MSFTLTKETEVTLGVTVKANKGSWGTIDDLLLIKEDVDKTEEWLMSTLKEMGYKDIKNIFLAEYDKGQLHIAEY